ncbi:MAG: Ig-like domain-containing protein [Candidatus Bathyarchaeota archaeon]|nr:Ig-like domain-containing protein [Candidatus Bathyarchaeota archaeon]MDH5494426.1 Ig-like domain-containing protein [Candidatus Bathyarchaeota archaeon]
MHRKKASKLVAAITMAFFLTLMLSRVCSAQNYEQQYFLLKGQSTYRLTLSITHSLYEYYQQKNHQLTQDNFASFVTPYSLALVAEDIRSIFPDEENFVNAVLMLVHQIPYQIVEEAKYPVETIVENKGDCDLLSYVATSLIKSQDLSVVLLYYEQESHMNIGVSLLNPPTNARATISHVDYMETRYYIAECTGDDWRNGWRVGECPPELEGAQVTVVTLENSEQIAPGQVSSSFGTLKSSAISLTTSSNFVIEGSAVVITGQVSASNPEGTVTLYAATNGYWFSIETVELDSSGQYVFSWIPPLLGQYYVKASWSGDAEYAGADSGTVSIYVVPEILVFAGGGLVVITIIVVVLFLMYRTTHPQEMQTLEAVSQ